MAAFSPTDECSIGSFLRTELVLVSRWSTLREWNLKSDNKSRRARERRREKRVWTAVRRNSTGQDGDTRRHSLVIQKGLASLKKPVLTEPVQPLVFSAPQRTSTSATR